MKYIDQISSRKVKKLSFSKINSSKNGKEVKVPSSEITIGDVILLNAGDLIPADLRIIESTDLYINQSSLTGESEFG